jgi:hypothetical protein
VNAIGDDSRGDEGVVDLFCEEENFVLFYIEK